MTVYPKKVCWREVTVPHGLFIQSCYWSNEFLFWEVRPLCLRVSLVEQAVISLLLWGRAWYPWWNAVARKNWVETGSDVSRAECSVLSGINGHGSMKPCLLQMRTEAQICSVCRQAAKGNQALQGVCSPLILEREAEDIFSVFRWKGEWDHFFD